MVSFLDAATGIVIGYPEDEPEKRAFIDQVLLPGDIVVPSPEPGSIDLWQTALLSAESDLIFVSELHCIPAKDTLSSVITAAEKSGLDAFSVNTGHINKSDIAWMEEEIFHTLEPELNAPGQWNLIRLRGFVIRKEWVTSTGGFKTDYDLFSELVLSLDLHLSGAKVGLQKDPTVYHINQTTMPLHRSDIERFVFGEMKYRADTDEAVVLPFLGVPENTVDFWRDESATGSRILTAFPILLATCRFRPLLSFLLRNLPRFFSASLFGLTPRIVKKTLTRRWWEFRFATTRGRTASRFALYRNQTLAHVDECRLRGFTNWPQKVPVGQFIETEGKQDWNAPVVHKGGIPIRWLGFYGLETFGENSFRWGAGICGWQLPLATGVWKVVFDTGEIRRSSDVGEVLALWQEEVVPVEFISEGRYQIRVVSQGLTESQLLLFVSPCKNLPASEPRELALPIRSLFWYRQD
jgi:hypothetical protein